MAVPKTQKRGIGMTVCRQGRAYKDNPIPTSFFLHHHSQKSHSVTCRRLMGLRLCMPCLACTLPSLYLVFVVSGAAIPTSLYIFGKCFSYLFVHVFFDSYKGSLKELW